jgi:hypothetical protein
MRKPKSVFVYLLHFQQPIAPGRHNGKALCPICAQGGERVIGEDVNFYPMLPDFAGALEDYAKGARYCPTGIDWAAVEEERIGD